MLMLNFAMIYPIYGDVLGLQLYKYFDTQNMLSSVFNQLIISVLGNDFFGVLLLLVGLSVLGFFWLDLVDFTPIQESEAD